LVVASVVAEAALEDLEAAAVAAAERAAVGKNIK
jgi:hypothetical protein